MALGAMIAGIASGYVQNSFALAHPPSSYAWFFVTVCFCTIPGMLTLLFIPMDKADIKAAPVGLD
jgi:PAT family beta-lactamase induction signal transducer AmpG